MLTDPCRAPPSSPAAAADETVIEANGKMIVVESDGTIIIGGPEAVARAQAKNDALEAAPEFVEVEYLTGRANAVQKHFGSALGADDFMQRVEMALFAFGFTGDNSIGEGTVCWSLMPWMLRRRPPPPAAGLPNAMPWFYSHGEPVSG